jgi:preprotein translocase subunit SecF
VHDTIVVFDRVRENLLRFPNEPFKLVLNHSLFQTLGRSLTTSITVVFTLLAIILFGGETIKWFAIILMIGIVSGTYSSIFNASQVLYAWTAGDFGRLFRRVFRSRTPTGPDVQRA